jgi:hypothetical protein
MENGVNSTNRKKRKCVNESFDIKKGKILKKRRRSTERINLLCREVGCVKPVKYIKTSQCENHGRITRARIVSDQNGGHCIILGCYNKIRRQLLCYNHYNLLRQGDSFVVKFVDNYNEVNGKKKKKKV